MKERLDTHTPNEWTGKILRLENKRRVVKEAALAGDKSTLVELGFPKGLVPAMEIWAKEIPDLVTSYAHPGEPRCFYSVVAGLRLSKILKELKLRDLSLEVKVIYYDTVDLYPFAKMPFRVTMNGESFGTDGDIFGINKLHSRDIVYKTTLQEKHGKLIKKTDALIGGIMQWLHFTSETDRKTFSKDITGRLEEFCSLFGKVLNNIPEKVTVDEFLTLMHWEVVKNVFNVGDEFESLEGSIGLKASIYSTDIEYLSTVRRSLRAILESYGVSILKQLALPGSGHLISEVLRNKTKTHLTVNEKGSFVLTKDNKMVEELGDDEAMELAVSVNGLPFSRLENLVLYGLSTNYQYGSEHELREPTLAALGHSGKALELCQNLWIGSDKKHGVNIVPKLSSYFAYILFGKENYKQLCLDVINNDMTDVSSISELENMVIKRNKSRSINK